VLALHGFSSNRLIFAGLARAFHGEAEVIAIDCRGRGRSAGPDEPSRYGMRRHAQDAAAVLTALDRRDVVVVGTSMGAWIATQLAAHHPDLVRSLVLVDGGYLQLLPPGTDPVEFVNLVLLGALDRMDLVLPDLDAAMMAMSAAPGLASIWDADVEASMRESFEPVAGGVRGRLRRSVAIADARSYNDPVEAPYLRQDTKLVACPVHLITAPDGLPLDVSSFSPPIMPPETVAELREVLPQLTVAEAPGTNHFTVCIGAVCNELVVEATRRACS
jgi:pimeloyl-ACP methyl ester carboxylesterase